MLAHSPTEQYRGEPKRDNVNMPFHWLTEPHLRSALLQDLLVNLEQSGSEVIHCDGAESKENIAQVEIRQKKKTKHI